MKTSFITTAFALSKRRSSGAAASPESLLPPMRPSLATSSRAALRDLTPQKAQTGTRGQTDQDPSGQPARIVPFGLAGIRSSDTRDYVRFPPAAGGIPAFDGSARIGRPDDSGRPVHDKSR